MTHSRYSHSRSMNDERFGLEDVDWERLVGTFRLVSYVFRYGLSLIMDSGAILVRIIVPRFNAVGNSALQAGRVMPYAILASSDPFDYGRDHMKGMLLSVKYNRHHAGCVNNVGCGSDVESASSEVTAATFHQPREMHPDSASAQQQHIGLSSSEPESLAHDFGSGSAQQQHVKRNSMPVRAIIICDALRDYQQNALCRKVQCVVQNIVLLGFDKYDVTPTMVYWPPGEMLPTWRLQQKMKRLTIKMIEESALVVITGGNGHALLQSFQEHDNLRQVLKDKIDSNLIMLLSWSAGSVAAGQWAAHSKDSVLKLRRSLSPRTRIVTGLRFITDLSFAPHVESDSKRMIATIRKMHAHGQLRAGHYAFLPDGTYVVFTGTCIPTYWNSKEIGWITIPCGN